MISAVGLSLSVITFTAVTICVSGAPFDITNGTSTSHLDVSEAAGNASVIQPISDTALKKALEKDEIERARASSDWVKNAAGKWEWKGKTTKSRTAANSTTAQAVALIPQLSVTNSSNGTEIKLILEPVNATTAASTHATASASASITQTRAAALNGTTAERKEERARTSPNWMQNSLGQWEWIGKSTPKRRVAANTTAKAQKQDLVSSTKAASFIPQILLTNSTNGTREIELVLEPVNTTTSTLTQANPLTSAGSTQAQTSLALSSTTVATASMSTLPAVVPQMLVKNETKDGELIGIRAAIVLEPLAEVLNKTPEATHTSTAVQTSSTAASVSSSAASQAALSTTQATSSSSASTTALLSSSSGGSSTSQASVASTVAAAASAENPAAVAKASQADKDSQIKAGNKSLMAGSTVYNSLSELAASGLKVGEKLEVSAVDSKTNTITLSITTENGTSSVVVDKSASQTTSTAAASTSSSTLPPVSSHPAAVATDSDTQLDIKPASHLLIPLAQVPGSKASHWSGAVSQMNRPQEGAARPAPHADGGSKAEKKEEVKKEHHERDHWSGSATELGGEQKNSGPVPEPAKTKHNAHQNEGPKHWSGSASQMGNSQSFPAKAAGPDDQGKRAHNKQAPATPQIAITGYDKVPYLWDSLMRGVIGMIGTASNLVAPVLESDQLSGSSILSSLPNFDIASIQNAKDSTKVLGPQSLKTKTHHN